MPSVRVDVFGGLRPTSDEVPLALPGTRASAVLAVLVLARCRPVSAVELVSWVWGDDPPASATNQLQRLVGQLRRTFDPSLRAREVGDVVLGAGDGYRLASGVESDLFDLDEGTLKDPLAVVGRRPFAGLESTLAKHPWYVAVERQRVASAVGALDEPTPSSVDRVQVIAAQFPFEEQLQARLMSALAAVGRRSEALELYEEARTRLVDELGIEPGPELRAAHALVLREDDPPTAPSRQTVPAQLPRVVGGFVPRPGAQNVLDQVAADGRAGTVTLTAIGGMGGIGKTALAVAWAHQLAPRFPDGQLYLNLRGYDASGQIVSPDDAVSALLVALGSPRSNLAISLEAKSAQLRSAMAGRRYLLVLDNARDAEQVRPLLPGDPGCLALVTSRDRLTSLVVHEGAVPVFLDRMSDDEARSLLAERLGWAALEADPTATQRVLEACDGLPLALAIVATQVVVNAGTTLAEVAGELARVSLADWSAGIDSVDLRTVFGWSYDTLSPDAARAFRLICAHPATQMSLASLSSLLGLPPQAARALTTQLCDANLLQRSSGDHFVLHDLLREYALAMPDPDGDRDEAERRVVNHFAWSANNTRLARGQEPRWSAGSLPGVTPEEYADEGAAWAWYLAERGNIDAVRVQALTRGWLREAAIIYVDLAWITATAVARRDERATLRQLLEPTEHAEPHEVFDDVRIPAELLRTLGHVELQLGQYDVAEHHLARAQRLLDGTTDRLLLASVLRSRGCLSLAQHDDDGAASRFQAAIDIAEAEGDDFFATMALLDLGDLHLTQEDWSAAAAESQRAHDIARRTGQIAQAIISALNLAEALIGLHRFEEALAAADAAIEGGAAETVWALVLRADEATAALGAGDVGRAGDAVARFWEVADAQSHESYSHLYTGGADRYFDQVRAVTAAIGTVTAQA